VDGQTVFAAAGDDGSEACNVNGESGADTGSAPGAQALNPTNGTLYVANASGGTVSLISEATDAVTATITTGNDPDAVLYDAATSELYVANYGSDSLTEVSTTNCNATASSGCASTTPSRRPRTWTNPTPWRSMARRSTSPTFSMELWRS
jgi:YVTN family beta-propeller protein